jgi:hypothetical protein
MKLSKLTLVAVLFASANASPEAVLKEDAAFWNRLVEETSFTPPPTAAPACDVKVETECKASSNGQECKTLEARTENCKEEICYTYTIDNVGTTDMDVTVFERYYNGGLDDLLDMVATNPLPVGETTTIEEKIMVDLCESKEYCIDTRVEANPEDGGSTCSSDDSYKFNIGNALTPAPTPEPSLPQRIFTPVPTRRPTLPPTPRPTMRPTPGPTPEPTSPPTPSPTEPKNCLTEVQIDCKTSSNGQACDTLGSRTSDCIEELCYTYTIDNVGTSDMDITTVERYFNGDLEDMLDMIKTTRFPKASLLRLKRK